MTYENEPEREVDQIAIDELIIKNHLEYALMQLMKLPSSRKVSMVKTKIDEAKMWLNEKE